jgi:hypothetical protein
VMKIPVLFPVSSEFRTAVWDERFGAEILLSISLSSKLDLYAGSAVRCRSGNRVGHAARNSKEVEIAERLSRLKERLLKQLMFVRGAKSSLRGHVLYQENDAR